MTDLRYGTVAGFAAAAGEANRRRGANARVVAFGIAVVVALGGTSGWIARPDATDQLVPVAPAPADDADVRPGRADIDRRKNVSTVPGERAAAVWLRPGDEAAVARAGDAARPGPADRPDGTWSTPITSHAVANPLGCVTIQPPAECFNIDGPSVTGNQATLVARHCTNTEREVTFADDVEVEFWVMRRDNGRTVWRSLTERPAQPAPHSQRMNPGSCIEWSTTWYRRGDDGREMPNGDYRVFVRARSPEITSTVKYVNFSLT